MKRPPSIPYSLQFSATRTHTPGRGVGQRHRVGKGSTGPNGGGFTLTNPMFFFQETAPANIHPLSKVIAYFGERKRSAAEAHLFFWLVQAGEFFGSYIELSRAVGHSHMRTKASVKNLVGAGLIHCQRGCGRGPNSYLVVGSEKDPIKGVVGSKKDPTTLYIYKSIYKKNTKIPKKGKKNIVLSEKGESVMHRNGNAPSRKPRPRSLTHMETKVLIDGARTTLRIQFAEKGEYARTALKHAAQRLAEGYEMKDLIAVLGEAKRRSDSGMKYSHIKDLKYIWSTHFEWLLNERPNGFKRESAAERHGLVFRKDKEFEEWQQGIEASKQRHLAQAREASLRMQTRRTREEA